MNRKKKILVTGGAGFIGRWVVKRLLEKDCCVWIIDNLENGSKENLSEFKNDRNLKDLIIGDVVNRNDILPFIKSLRFLSFLNSLKFSVHSGFLISITIKQIPAFAGMTKSV